MKRSKLPMLFNASDNADYSYLDYRYYGALLSALKKYDQAVAEYGKALGKDSDQVDIWREIADAYELKNDYAQAITAYQKYYDALSQDKKTAESLFQLGRLYYGQAHLRIRSPFGLPTVQRHCRLQTLCLRWLPDKLPTAIWVICGAPVPIPPWTRKLPRGWQNLIMKRWRKCCWLRMSRGITLH